MALLLLLTIINGAVNYAHSSTSSPSSSRLPAPANSTTDYEFLKAHNVARAAVQVGPLRWNRKLASRARRLATETQQRSGDPASCEFSDLPSTSLPYGANQAVGNFLVKPTAVVGSWVEEARRHYNYFHNSCDDGHESECEAYTQVVWRKTKEIGCGRANCGKDGALTICLYYPRGNIPGQRPY
ncbi:hypothetical protein HPP92_020085 [Vanilla planifolia]|uniref:SCP domain-containing protein n=1 Tax=Vanilla planifolia TaxID=51239 RepID=A0A835PB70_VANPL|nr:hypothetical protein HPP92_027796 [Vanilla planifolia]KAG0465921.1 hypothetical protein HPP92_020085 [Vanilla planifolia]